MCIFLADIGDDLSYSTLNNYVSALNVLSKMYEDSFDLRQDYGISLLLKGFKRLKGEATSPKDPLLPEDLKNIYKLVDTSNHTQLVVWIIIVLAFRTLLRKCHFVSSSDEDIIHLLRAGDVKFEPWCCKIIVSSSKTIQFQERSLSLPVSWASHPLCAATLLRLFAELPKVRLRIFVHTSSLRLATPCALQPRLELFKRLVQAG